MKKMTMAMVGLTAVATIAALPTTASAAATISDVIVSQQWPWNGKVNIDYVLSDPANGDHDISVVLRNGSDVITNEYGSLSGDLIGVRRGARRIVWDPSYGGATYSDKVLTDFSATLSTPGDGKTYMVVDMTDGSVTFTDTPPDGGWNQDTYKTDKLVLRRIPAGTAILGSPEGEATVRNPRYEVQRRTTFTNDFYIAIFETTQKQFENVMGYNPTTNGKGDTRPVSYVNYQLLRGTNSFVKDSDQAGGTWPQHESTSFFGVLNSKLPDGALSAVGLGDYELELPTASQWEYACRAGTTGAWNNGTTITNETKDANADILAWYDGTSSAYAQAAGQKVPNAYGLYDMHGNVAEYTRDRVFDNINNPPAVWNGSDEIEPLAYQYQVGRSNSCLAYGGFYNQGSSYGAKIVRASSVAERPVSSEDPKRGFRVVLTRKR